ncbi:hypothetical protein [Plantactinospora sp. KLBMP9567]|uniref:hypothetical protein n=1 Tax=Plantactinospora sp. KLBMP9567 TaxID=3085900 RepID=UPI002980BCF7|nr:hypothetical protein [Plantactinospora sp. KLBMP9567]MDW5327201.1 hypothetical protein [Plantactinospora sp. KLBMP9567]
MKISFAAITKALPPLLVMGVLAGGCSSAAKTTTAGEPEITQLLDVSSLANFSFPLDPYRSLPWQDGAIQQAEHLLVERCLLPFGLEAPTPAKLIPVRDIHVERRYSLVPAADAARYGWKMPPKADQPDDKPSEELLSGEVKAVLSGRGPSTYNGRAVPKGGCYGEARRTLGTDIDPERLTDDLDFRALDMTKRHSRVVAATRQWSSCMKSAGFDYSSPENAVADPMLQGETTSEAEIRVASASVDCATKADLLAISLTVDVAYQERLLEENASTLAAIKDAREKARRKASEILNGG